MRETHAWSSPPCSPRRRSASRRAVRGDERAPSRARRRTSNRYKARAEVRRARSRVRRAAKPRGKTLFDHPVVEPGAVRDDDRQPHHADRDADGVKVTIWKNQGQPSEWVQGMNAAIAQNANAIVLLAGNDPAASQPRSAPRRPRASRRSSRTSTTRTSRPRRTSPAVVEHPLQDRRPADRRPGDRRHARRRQRPRHRRSTR